MKYSLKTVIQTGLTISLFSMVNAPFSQADEIMQRGLRNAQCVIAASQTYKVPTPLILILLQVEGGSLGKVSQNTNDTVDIGPMQVNQIWVNKIANHWKTSPEKAALFLKNNFCANVEAGTWILSLGLTEAKGDFWKGVGYYHSHNKELQDDYLRKVLRAVIRLQKQSRPPHQSNRSS